MTIPEETTMDINTIQGLLETRLGQGKTTLGEETAKQILKTVGIPVVGELVATTPEAAVRAADDLGYPVVLKGGGDGVLHKTESGLVAVGLEGPDSVLWAARAMTGPDGEPIGRFLVQPRVKGRREFMAGMVRDPQFGPVILFGLGGIYAEALEDTVMKLAPLSDADIRDMLDGIRSRRLLSSVRGETGADRIALARVLKGLADLALACPDISEIDINPLIIQPDGSPVAVDGLILLEPAPPETRPSYTVPADAFKACYYPRSTAFIGATAGYGKWGYLLPSDTLSRGYDGTVFLVNPKGGEILGQKVYPSIGDIERDIDLAVVTIPADKVMGILPELAEKKTRALLLITSGFREVGEAGAALEKQIMDTAAGMGITVFGPNTMGVLNPHASFFCTASHAHPIPGSTALVCQSGNMGTQLLTFAEQQGVGIRAYSGSGNEAMVTIEDYMELFERDDLTHTVVLYVESIHQGRRFFESARRVSRKKPVVVLKGGRTETGGQAAASHTGAMASDAKVFDAACRQAGIIQVLQPMDLLDLSAAFSSLPLPRGSRVAVMTFGGGWGVVTSDLCAEYGFQVPDLPRHIIETLDTLLPEYWSRRNPVDLVGEMSPDLPRRCLEELLKWDGCDAVLHLGVAGQRILGDRLIESASKVDPRFTAEKGAKYSGIVAQMDETYIDDVIRLTNRYEKTVIGVSFLSDEKSRILYRREGDTHKGVFFPSPERAVKALAAMYRYQQWRQDGRMSP